MFPHASVRRILPLRPVFAFLLLLLSLPVGLAAQTAEDIINAYLKARGGVAKIKSVQSERVSGTITLGPDNQGLLVYERKRPLKMYMEIRIGSDSFIRVYDGKSAGWIYNPFAPNAAVQPMADAELRGAADEADFEGPFLDYKAKGNKIEYAGKEEVEGKPTQKLKLTDKQGEVSYFFFDASTGLVMKWLGARKAGDKDLPWESFFRDFRDVDGLKYPFLVESGPVGGDKIQKIIADKIEINIPIDDSRFAKPAIPAPPAAAGDPPKSN